MDNSDPMMGLMEATINEVLAALKLYNEKKTDDTQRIYAKTLLSAIDYNIWVSRRFVAKMIAPTLHGQSKEFMALTDDYFNVDEKGGIRKANRYTDTVSAILLCRAVCLRLDSNHVIDIRREELELVRNSNKIRNRLVHPKVASDLKLSSDDINTCYRAYIWSQHVLTYSMDACERVLTEQAVTFLSGKRSPRSTR